jgi:small-conductance mechanosensitive channel
LCGSLATLTLLPGIAARAAEIAGASPAGPQVHRPPADLEVANRYITTLRAEVFGVGPTERAGVIRERIEEIVDQGGELVVSTQTLPEGAAVLINDRVAFRILVPDLEPDTIDTPANAANLASQRLELALQEMEEARDARTWLPAIGFSLLATAGLVLLLWVLLRFQRWFTVRAQGLVHRTTTEFAPSWFGQLFGHAGLRAFVTVPVRIAVWLLGLLFLYQYTGFVLRQFPYTRPWGETLQTNLFAALGRFGADILHALPGLLFVVLIFAIARLVARAVRAFFTAVQARRIEVAWVDETTARPTERLASVVIWLFALVAAYPYIPGSDSEAFKGVGVFVGLMLSLGASGIVNQAVSGLMLMYTRSIRPGEFVRIGDMEGTVRAVGFLTTRLETLRREEVSIPNSVIATSITRNFSRLAAEGNLQVPTQVTIGYDTPWRQVHAMLLEAATRTRGVADVPLPRVLQSDLKDFYAEYTLLVPVKDPRTRPSVLSELHGHIQDVFNEHGVQIMSPNYEADPETPKVVSREDWYKAPADSASTAHAAKPVGIPSARSTS